MAHKIEKEDIKENLLNMINLLEYDSMRSPGKAKLNSQHLHSMYWLLQNVYKDVKIKKPTAEVSKEG